MLLRAALPHRQAASAGEVIVRRRRVRAFLSDRLVGSGVGEADASTYRRYGSCNSPRPAPRIFGTANSSPGSSSDPVEARHPAPPGRICIGAAAAHTVAQMRAMIGASAIREIGRSMEARIRPRGVRSD